MSSKYDAEITSPAPGSIQLDGMGRIRVRVWAKGIEYPAQVFAGADPDADQGPLEATGPNSDDYEGEITVPNGPFTLCAKAEWTKATGEIESVTRNKGTYTPQ
jgi:hypothetical protein